MNKFILKSIIVGIILCILSCATSMSPIEVNDTLPTFTKSRLISQADAVVSVTSDKCKYLVRGRSYVAPIGLIPKNDLKGAAKGIDEWVQLDGEMLMF